MVLHYNGHAWRRAATSRAFSGYGALDQIAPDGTGGLWIPMPGFQGGTAYLAHYSDGRLTAARLPLGGARTVVSAIAAVPHSGEILAGGFTHTAHQAGKHIVAVILRYGS